MKPRRASPALRTHCIILQRMKFNYSTGLQLAVHPQAPPPPDFWTVTREEGRPFVLNCLCPIFLIQVLPVLQLCGGELVYQNTVHYLSLSFPCPLQQHDKGLNYTYLPQHHKSIYHLLLKTHEKPRFTYVKFSVLNSLSGNKRMEMDTLVYH